MTTARNVLERDYHMAGPALAEPGEAQVSILDWQLSAVRNRIRREGLRSLRWVSGTHTGEIAASLLDVLSEQGREPSLILPREKCRILVSPGESHLVDVFGQRFGWSIKAMEDLCTDSFLVVNDAAVLDVTPASSDDGAPEFSDDPIVVSLYVGLFNMLNSQFPGP